MDRQLAMLIFGIAAIVLYSASWVMQIFGFPGHNFLRVSALAPFAIGLGILLYDRYKKANYYKKDKKRENGWEDLLGEDEEEDEQN